MEDDFRDWELLTADTNPKPLPPRPSSLVAKAEPDPDAAGAIKSDYFSITNQPSHNNDEEDLSDSPNPSSWVDPDSDHFAFSDQNRDKFFTPSDSPASASEEEEEEEEVEPVNLGCPIGEVSKGTDGSVIGWWRLPFEFVKVWVMRARPMWSVSIAVAVLGVVLLGRKLYRMRKESKAAVSRIKIVLDQKKTSQLKSQVTRLNEAFSVVRRAPLIKPSVPVNGVTPWPVLGIL